MIDYFLACTCRLFLLQCVGWCSAGTFSADRYRPCTACDGNTYADTTGNLTTGNLREKTEIIYSANLLNNDYNIDYIYYAYWANLLNNDYNIDYIYCVWQVLHCAKIVQ